MLLNGKNYFRNVRWGGAKKTFLISDLALKFDAKCTLNVTTGNDDILTNHESEATSK